MSDRIIVEVVDGIAYATLNRADKLNALDLPMLQALASTPGEIAKDKSIRAVILQGAGTSFCSGLDFASVGKDQMGQIKGFAKLPVQTTNTFQKACWGWRELPVPVIAVVRGHCFGGGMQLALAADFRFTTPDTEFSIMEGKWGLIPDMTGSVTLRELVPMDVAKRLTMTAEIFDGARAKRYGLVTDVSSDPLAGATELAHQIVAKSPDAIAATKKLFHETWTESPRAAFWTESQLQLKLILGKNHKIARAAAAAKELPKWVARSM
ncbi:crotonase/enoyl-CoA hydratase family protein [Antrihabitans sp. YC2-6]|uniref:crotonase/enoyl-CoA hydratase family protein n=1 Tax=Antrihabitans sp. YC2-6 TaxID=2799498 RepID=UPI0018F44614|nr:crotonase/enoyl-CoA hydratase family protein [Antrihabitans sp. YC2-6]MBJ8343083.1 crotonase/enoyl-CoA hydratase family protein [Antrihabitans sp. YC2-6]